MKFGLFCQLPCAPEQHAVTRYHETLEQIVLRLDLKAGEQRTGLALMYNPAAERTITGRVTDTDGNPLAKATMGWGSAEHGWAELTWTRDDGTYTVRGLIDGIYELVYFNDQPYDKDSIEGTRRAARPADEAHRPRRHRHRALRARGHPRPRR